MPAALPVHRPRSVAEALSLLDELRQQARLLAGGTDLMVLLNARLLAPAHYIDLWPIDELRGISDQGATLRIGALTTFTEIIRSPLIEKYAPALSAAARTIGAIQIQNRGTLGGNIANASPAGDSLPVLAAANAEIEIASQRQLRRVSFNEFYTGYRKTVLAPDEMILAVHLPKLPESAEEVFYKIGTRRAQAISKVMLGARLELTGDRIDSIALGYGSVAPTVIRAWRTESLLTGERITPELLERTRETLGQDLSPISDLRSTAEYRLRVAGNLLVKLLGCSL